MKPSDLGLNILAYSLLAIAGVAAAHANSKRPDLPPTTGTATLVSSDLEPITGTVYEHVVLADGMPCVRSITNAGSLSVQVGLACDFRGRKP